MRSGRANGMDVYAEVGCDEGDGKKEIYLPYEGFGRRFEFNGGQFNAASVLKPTPWLWVSPTVNAFNMARGILGEMHWGSPGMRKAHDFGRKAHARNCHQVLGRDLDIPSKFVILWAPWRNRAAEIARGGTNTALQIARAHNIPWVNMFDEGWADRLNALLAQLK
jgi:hypothetical protein